MIDYKLRSVKEAMPGKYLLAIEMSEPSHGQAEEATDRQAAFLSGHGMWCEGMTKGCASVLIHLIRHGAGFREKP